MDPALEARQLSVVVPIPGSGEAAETWPLASEPEDEGPPIARPSAASTDRRPTANASSRIQRPANMLGIVDGQTQEWLKPSRSRTDNMEQGTPGRSTAPGSKGEWSTLGRRPGGRSERRRLGDPPRHYRPVHLGWWFRQLRWFRQPSLSPWQRSYQGYLPPPGHLWLVLGSLSASPVRWRRWPPLIRRRSPRRLEEPAQAASVAILLSSTSVPPILSCTIWELLSGSPPNLKPF